MLHLPSWTRSRRHEMRMRVFLQLPHGSHGLGRGGFLIQIIEWPSRQSIRWLDPTPTARMAGEDGRCQSDNNHDNKERGMDREGRAREGKGCAARRSRPVFRLETLRWNLEIERAGNQVQVGHRGAWSRL